VVILTSMQKTSIYLHTLLRLQIGCHESQKLIIT